MTSYFVLSLPRSRTAWLATYLNGGGIHALHEGWRHAKTAKQLRRLMEDKGEGGVNVDSANWFFLDEIMAEWPNAQFIRIDRPLEDVERSLESAIGVFNYRRMLEDYERAIARSMVTPVLTIDFNKWTPAASLRIWKTITGTPIDPYWHQLLHEMRVALTPDALNEELECARRGEFDHMARKLTGGRHVCQQ